MKPDYKGGQKPLFNESTANLLPAPVSEIQVQKKNKNRFSLFVENEFLIGVSEHVLSKLNLEKGVEITPFLLEEIVKEENRSKARSYIFKILGRRDHSKKELMDKARRKGYKTSVIEEVIEEFESKGYIDDVTFARKFTADKYEFNNWGPYKIRTHLFKKGISRGVAEEALSEVFDPESVRESLFELVNKHKAKFRRAEKSKRKEKIFSFLMRKGYDSDNIWQNMDELLKLIES